jgi:glycosyltransferase involved in cell wall biosynthesis
MRYSICVTAYNSEDVVDDFLTPLIKTGYEIIVVDNMSTDKTPELLSKYRDNIKIIERKCSRGLGRKIGIENSTGDVIIIVDFDIELFSLGNIVEQYEKMDDDKIYVFHLTGGSCCPNIFIGKKSLFEHYDPWQDVNCMEDVYFERVCRHFDALRRIQIEADYKCLKIRNKGPGSESRYEPGRIGKAVRRIKCTADIIFVSGLGYRKLLEYYKLKYIKEKLYGLALYIPAKLISYFIKAPSVNFKIREIENYKSHERN